MKKNQTIAQVRQRIDEIDDTILSLLKERLACAKDIGKLKSETKRAKWDPQRELEIYERLKQNNNDIFPPKALYSIFHEIITSCRLSQRKASVAYLGPEATFTHLAGVKYFGQTAEYRPMESIPEVFQEVEASGLPTEILKSELERRGFIVSDNTEYDEATGLLKWTGNENYYFDTTTHKMVDNQEAYRRASGGW